MFKQEKILIAKKKTIENKQVEKKQRRIIESSLDSPKANTYGTRKIYSIIMYACTHIHSGLVAGLRTILRFRKFRRRSSLCVVLIYHV